MKKLFTILLLSATLSGCDVLSNLPGVGGGVTESEAGEGIKEALGQGLVKAVLKLNTVSYTHLLTASPKESREL